MTVLPVMTSTVFTDADGDDDDDDIDDINTSEKNSCNSNSNNNLPLLLPKAPQLCFRRRPLQARPRRWARKARASWGPGVSERPQYPLIKE